MKANSFAMIVTFSVSNFRSFQSEETLNLVASKRLYASHSDHMTDIPASDQKVLRTAVLYGANGAGKSNLFKALRYLKQLAIRPRPKGSSLGREPFLFASGASEPTSFDLQFIVGKRMYRFGIEIDDQKILNEWLVRIDGGKEKTLYERSTGADGEVVSTAHRTFKVSAKLRALLKVGGPPNQTFLATIKANLNRDDIGLDINQVLDWFSRALMLIGPDEPFAPLGHILAEDESFLDFAGQFLKSASTGVDHLKVLKKEISEKDLKDALPTFVFDDVFGALAEQVLTVVGGRNGEEYIIERGDENHLYQIDVESAHKSPDGTLYNLPLEDESDGTRRLLELVPTLHRMKGNRSVYFIDEIDRSLHPALVHKFLEFFLRSCDEGQHQIIVTTHESTLLDLDLLRRDEIWFTEKDTNNATRLYSLDQFKVRNDLMLSKHYLQGRFGAIPFLGNLDCLLEAGTSRSTDSATTTDSDDGLIANGTQTPTS